MFILGTSSVLALVPQDQIDLVSPIPQTLTIGFAGMGFASLIAPLLIGMLLLRQIGNVSLIFAGNTRLPMVAGWDGLLPAWFTRLHPRFRTPMQLDPVRRRAHARVHARGPDRRRRAGGVSAARERRRHLLRVHLPRAVRDSALRGAPAAAPAAALAAPRRRSGLAVTALYCVLSIFPIIDVPSWRVFSLKIVAVLVVTQLVGVAVYVVEDGGRPDRCNFPRARLFWIESRHGSRRGRSPRFSRAVPPGLPAGSHVPARQSTRRPGRRPGGVSPPASARREPAFGG